MTPASAGLPDGVLAMAGRGPDWASWVDGLPGTLAAVQDEWQLVADGRFRHGHCSLVLPVRTASRRPAVLKLGFADDESEHEHLALQHWHGDGAVQLLRADPHRRAMLLERLHTEDLTGTDDVEACEVVAGLYSALHRPAPPRLRRLSTVAARWASLLHERGRSATVPRRLTEHAVALARSFADDEATDGTMVHTDLHYENVLAGDRSPWLVIDPKPLSGDPHLEPAPMLFNRWEEVLASGDARDAVRRRFHTLVDVAGLDEHRARDWVVVRCAVNALVEATAPDPDRAWVTTNVAVAKAVQD